MPSSIIVNPHCRVYYYVSTCLFANCSEEYWYFFCWRFLCFQIAGHYSSQMQLALNFGRYRINIVVNRSSLWLLLFIPDVCLQLAVKCTGRCIINIIENRYYQTVSLFLRQLSVCKLLSRVLAVTVHCHINSCHSRVCICNLLNCMYRYLFNIIVSIYFHINS